ncbi:MAG TPA: bifunctional [glutamate--ammonia ligase]-adenylyl-L-tyrosine phosphorylase/[glutamate--ammonia-ligase] adenylyltransferase [Steroidobacteraceae bacterium]|nr:bifunctional [glutamate--ammonia ligase]-adenylyl-L-tyrosine phosphorylase/[glutamate--ammonia-ligase] adenylyltransferase [Steroidobacteraceae bacterium]
MSAAPSLSSLPESLRASTQRTLDAFAAQEGSAGLLERLPAAVRDALPLVWALSDFAGGSCARDPAMLDALIASGELTARRPPTVRMSPLFGALDTLTDEVQFMRELRRARRRELVRIAWRDLAGWAEVDETLADLSVAADGAIDSAVRFATRQLIGRFGTPRSPDGSAQELTVIAMGKLGGRELNFSSDVDLVLLFPELGETDGRRSIANEDFFTRLGQQVIRLLETQTADGFVYRVDLRLRPFGDSGPLVASIGAFENYLEQHGRDWERYAYVKARAVTGFALFEQAQRDLLRPFVYRRYLDFRVFEALREMKELIAREVERRELEHNVKLGPGGIREIEFIAQAFQLLRGGSDRRLQQPSLLTVLPLLAGERLLPPATVNDLLAAYRYLRRVENRLQMWADEQTHDLPEDDGGRLRLACSMGHGDWQAFNSELGRHRANVSRHFRNIILAPADGRDGEQAAPEWIAFWSAGSDGRPLLEGSQLARFGNPAEVLRRLIALREGFAARGLDENGRRRLAALLPRVVTTCAAGAAADATLARALGVLEAVGGRATYFALLNENAGALNRLIEVCRQGDFLATQISGFPLLLDELVDERVLEQPLTRSQLAAELAIRCQNVPDDDPEREIEALRQFQRAAVFRVAYSELSGRLPLMKVSDRLTEVAELILEEAMRLAWRQLTRVHGVPRCGTGESLRAVGIAAVAYGKLGGLELGYGSDLDLVFLHDSTGGIERTDGGKALENGVFFVRLAQRIVHLLTMHSAAGRLYEVDMRLRPSGKGGMLVTQLQEFARYQKEEAWTWEHQALLRARSVAGDPDVRASFESVRTEILRRAVRRENLRDEVRDMRERMRTELSRSGPGEFDLKQDPGGIADIEFLVQYWALKWAADYPAITMFTDNIRQLESLASAALVDQAIVDDLVGAYLRYRAATHRASLDGRGTIVDEAPYADTRAAVLRVWSETMLD